MRYLLNIKYTWIVYLEPGRGIDRHAYRDTVAATYSLQISRPRLGRRHRSHLDHYSGPFWVIQIEVTVLYSDDTFGYIQIKITVSYSDSTFGYIQLFPVSASKVLVDMKPK